MAVKPFDQRAAEALGRQAVLILALQQQIDELREQLATRAPAPSATPPPTV